MSGSIARRRLLTSSAAVGTGAAVSSLVPGTVGSASAASITPSDGVVQIFVNNVGYAPHAPKRAVLAAGSPMRIERFVVVKASDGTVAASGEPHYAGQVKEWGPQHYWTVDFSSVTEEDEYILLTESARDKTGKNPRSGRSPAFRIAAFALERYTLSHVLHYFKGMRCSGQFDKNDRALPVGQNGSGRIDAHGGWYDATGDFGKHFTQLSDASYFNTLSVPLTAWVLFKAHQQLTKRDNENFTQLRTWLCDEGMFGADYLARVKRANSTFASSVVQPGPPKDPTKRYLVADSQDRSMPAQVNFREGGGVAIAALALASTFDVSGEQSSSEYLQAAEDAFEYLHEHNVELTNDGEENIQDDYNALAAAVELYRATRKQQYRDAADSRVENLLRRLTSWHSYRDYWRADNGDRPYFHPSDAGFPVVSLMSYLEIADQATSRRVLDVVRRSLAFELSITGEVTNPFGYGRNLVQTADGERYSSFFFPHTVTPRDEDQWWQGENARIASLATAARLAAPHFDGDFAHDLRRYAADQLNWICGVNPYAVCMVDGSGQHNPQYEWKRSWQFLPTAGGIVNGMTGRDEHGRGILWDHGYAHTGKDDDWRWTEQWLPHSTWYLYAVSVGG